MTIESWYRRFLLVAAVGTYLAAAVELFLVEHYADALQFIPFSLILVGLAGAAVAWRKPARPSLQALRGASVLVVLGSLLGIVLHIKGNVEFALEVRPDIGLAEAIWEGMSGGSPLLAPGMIALAAVLAAAASYRHPALATGRRISS